MLVEPDIATTGFPFNCSIVRMLSAFRAANRVADRKCEFVNATWRCRSALLVVEEQTRSTVPFIMSGMRLDDVTGSVSTVTNGHVGEVELVLNCVHDFHADIDGVSNRLLIPIEIAEGH